MTANRVALLILKHPRWRLAIEPLNEREDGTFVIPLQWISMRRFREAEILDSSFCLSGVERVRFGGIAGPKDLGGFDLAYILILALGWISLATPVLVRLSLSKHRTLAIDEARTYIGKIVEESQLFPDVKAKLSKRIQRAKSIADMARAINDARE